MLLRQKSSDLDEMLHDLSGKTFSMVADRGFYGKNVADAMWSLLHVGLIKDDYVYRRKDSVVLLREAQKYLEAYIEELEK